MKQLPTLTIAVCAYNEEHNMKAFLKSILAQKSIGYRLKEIIVVSDGSTDHTVRIVKKLNSSIIKIWNHKIRLGKSSRLNEIYEYVKTDILVQTDADVIFSNPHVVSELIKPLSKKQVYMTGGNPKPFVAKTFIEKAINCTVEPYVEFRHKVRGGNNVFSVDGRLLAYKRELVKKIVVPADMIANDAYTYFCCLSLGYTYQFVSSAVVNFRSPQTLFDHIKQNTRFNAAPIRMEKIFDKKLVKREYRIPKKMYRKAVFNQWIQNPIHCSAIFVINMFCKLYARRYEPILNAKWAIAYTTKVLLFSPLGSDL